MLLTQPGRQLAAGHLPAAVLARRLVAAALAHSLFTLSFVSCSGPSLLSSSLPPLASPLTSLESYPVLNPQKSLELTQALLSLDLGRNVLNSQLLSMGLGISPLSGRVSSPSGFSICACNTELATAKKTCVIYIPFIIFGYHHGENILKIEVQALWEVR